MNVATFLLVLGFCACFCSGADIGALRARYSARYWMHRYPATTRIAYCKYGEYRRRECCYGWRYNGPSQCAPICEDGCVHGKCVGPNRCQCDKGYTGPRCNQDFNECSTKPCSHRCVNGIGSFRCFCPTGHVLLEDKVTCELDYRCHVDRCAYGCEQVGFNFRCLCPDGLKVSANGFHCEDIDECAEGMVQCPPDQRCHNTYGNYMCMCKEGFAFQMINRRLICKELNQCVARGLLCDTNAHCEDNNFDIVKCVCNEGYVGDGITCREVEPRTCANKPCFPGVVCIDIRLDLFTIDLTSNEPIKQYQCGPCPVGYTGDGERCFDINECETGEFVCHPNARCLNTPGSYQCRCNQGFLGDGKTTCVPIDPTTCASNPCFAGVRCIDVPIPRANADLSSVTIIKRYRCEDCPPGFEGDGETCADRNECEEGTFFCHRNASCFNNRGSYTCECDDGFAGDGRVCIPLDPRICADRPCFPGVDCEDIPLQRILNSPNWRQLDYIQLFRCGPCPRGYRGDGETCQDIDECQLGLDNCHPDALCINTPGSFECRCRPGFAGDGLLCVPIDSRSCADQPCFNGRVACRNLALQDVLRTIDLPNTPLVKLFQCGPCPDGYFGNGEFCEDINECLIGTFECHESATCNNTDGGYDCICNVGFAGDGKRCREIDPTTCNDNPCFPGVLCFNLPLDIDSLDLDTTDVIELYRCGNCPPGYRGDGKTCLDIDECAEGRFFCPENATCRNMPGTYDCVCNEGFYGDGQTCIPLDPRTCADGPCFQGVVCTVVDPATLDWRSLTIVKRFACGECPEGYVGDGEICKKLPPPIIVPKNVNLTVVVISARETSQNPLISDAKLKAYVADENEGTVEYASAQTGLNGIAKLPVPHNKSVIIGIEHEYFLSKSESYKAYLSQNNSLTVQLFEFNELTEFRWRTKTSRALELGDLLRLDIPQEGLPISEGNRVQITCRTLNVTLIDAPIEGPELIAGVENPQTGEVELKGLEVFGMTELKCLVRNFRPNSPLRPLRRKVDFTISLPVINLAKDPGAPMSAWRYHEDKGYWVFEGIVDGVTRVSAAEAEPSRGDAPAVESEQRQMWQFQGQNFIHPWWAFGRVWEQSSCVTVRACYDVDCRFPVANALIKLFGINFRYTTSRYTGLDGTVCMPFKTGGSVLLFAPCIGQQIEVRGAESRPPSNCGRDDIQNVLTPSKDASDGNCAEETFYFPRDKDQNYCGNPGDVEGTVRIGNDFYHGDEVIYMCENLFSSPDTNTRVCQSCGKWSGKEPSCSENSLSEFPFYGP